MTMFAFTIWVIPRGRLGATEDKKESESSVVFNFRPLQ